VDTSKILPVECSENLNISK
jgi:hypothetical protein